jgi:hypothetical protein
MAKKIEKTKDERKMMLSGAGLSRVQIAHQAMEKARRDLEEKTRRWEEAVAAEEANRGKNKEKEAAKLRRAADALEKAGMVEEATKARTKADELMS